MLWVSSYLGFSFHQEEVSNRLLKSSLKITVHWSTWKKFFEVAWKFGIHIGLRILWPGDTKQTVPWRDNVATHLTEHRIHLYILFWFTHVDIQSDKFRRITTLRAAQELHLAHQRVKTRIHLTGSSIEVPSDCGAIFKHLFLIWWPGGAHRSWRRQRWRYGALRPFFL